MAVAFCPFSVAAVANAKDDEDLVSSAAQTLQTKDGMELRAFYFPSDQRSRYHRNSRYEWTVRRVYYKLASALNEAGCAVLAPDYQATGIEILCQPTGR